MKSKKMPKTPMTLFFQQIERTTSLKPLEVFKENRLTKFLGQTFFKPNLNWTGYADNLTTTKTPQASLAVLRKQFEW